MDTGKPEGFKIDLDENDEAAETDALLPDAGIADLGRSPSIALVLVFVAILALILFVFLNLGSRINAITKAGETRIKTVSSGVGDRLDGITKNLNSIGKDLQKKTDALESHIKRDKEDIHRLSRETASLKKSVGSLVAIKKRLSRLDSSLKKIKAKTDKETIRIDKHLAATDSAIKELKTSADTIATQQNRIKELSSRINTISQSTIDKKQMSAAIDALKKEMSGRIDRAETLHAREVSAIRSELAGIKKTVKAAQHPVLTSPAPVVSKDPGPAPAVPDRIMEQEIK
ncbi:MAG: hypothetical protein GXP53_09975 [Deltaproteobacteria bacterium]|nr:hypothetical protein [Deltaproteobacteria bacterium]